MWVGALVLTYFALVFCVAILHDFHEFGHVGLGLQSLIASLFVISTLLVLWCAIALVIGAVKEITRKRE